MVITVHAQNFKLFFLLTFFLSFTTIVTHVSHLMDFCSLIIADITDPNHPLGAV